MSVVQGVRGVQGVQEFKEVEEVEERAATQRLEGSRFGACLKDLAYSFQREEGITQRDVLASGRFE